MKYKVVLKSEYNVLCFDFDKSDNAVDFAKKALAHMVVPNDGKNIVNIEFFYPESEFLKGKEV